MQITDAVELTNIIHVVELIIKILIYIIKKHTIWDDIFLKFILIIV